MVCLQGLAAHTTSRADQLWTGGKAHMHVEWWQLEALTFARAFEAGAMAALAACSPPVGGCAAMGTPLGASSSAHVQERTHHEHRSGSND